ncbi:hypothetical protein GQ43DRAFT_478383 [Delitschia confertaspora ATCC 74209]|uniref:Uncharacterized protein n=1 Tax=Delitschia confertaspora ATCC 74209 TaxID=1513339 RepID=A0A9P4MV17_9PLEO|nr:hypothetical protein GQ43DRAFT_478383 [Delitschia confertaspora ATCC 74209]
MVSNTECVQETPDFVTWKSSPEMPDMLNAPQQVHTRVFPFTNNSSEDNGKLIIRTSIEGNMYATAVAPEYVVSGPGRTNDIRDIIITKACLNGNNADLVPTSAGRTNNDVVIGRETINNGNLIAMQGLIATFGNIKAVIGVEKHLEIVDIELMVMPLRTRAEISTIPQLNITRFSDRQSHALPPIPNGDYTLNRTRREELAPDKANNEP